MTEVTIRGQVGPQSLNDGAAQAFRQDKSGAQVIQQLHGRLYEANYRSNLFMGGIVALTSISNTTYSINTLGATCTPVVGVWNPSTSPVNLVIVQAILGVTVTAATATGPGPFVWAASVQNVAIPSTGAQPTNCKSLVAQGAFAKDMSNAALTGQTNALTVKRAAALGGGNLKNISSVETAVGQNIAAFGITTEMIEGGIIVPPGGILALVASTTPVAHSAVSGLVWEEVPI